MDLTHKHGALIWTGILGAVFLGLLAWHMLAGPASLEPQQPAASTTPIGFTDPEPEIISEDGTYYDISAELPTLTPLSETANVAAISELRAFIAAHIQEFKRNGGLDDLTPEEAEFIGLTGERQYVLGMEYELFTGPHTVSYLYTIYEDTLGAHPNAYFRTFTFDTRTGASLSLEDLFGEDSGYLSWLSERTRRDIPLIVQQRSGYLPDTEYLNSGTEPTPESFQSFYIDGSSLVIAFPPYQVGPYALGSILAPIPLADMASLVRPEYQ